MLLFLPRNRLFLGLVFWGVLVLIGNIYLPLSDNPFVKIYFSPLTLEFIMGSFIAIMYYSRSIQGNAKAYALMSFSTWIGGYYLFQTFSGEITPAGWVRILVFGIPSALALYSALLYERFNGCAMPKWMCKIGDASYSIYLSHVIVLSIVGRLWVLFAAKGYLDNVIVLIIMFIAVIIVGYISFNFIEKTFLKKTQLFGSSLFQMANLKSS
jgi:peptidoglycan/LPS O-acetylase OafA/YrhL